MHTSTLKATHRETSGSARARVLRRNGLVPAVVYGPGKENLHIAVDPAALRAALKTPLRRNTLIELDIEAAAGRAAAKKTVMVRQYQTHQVFHDRLAHVDFYELDTAKLLKVKIPVEITGKSPAIKDGGIQEVKAHEILVACTPDKIPAKLVVDVSNLKLRESIHINEITLPEGVRAVYDKVFTIVTISLPQREKTTAESADAAAEAAAAGGAAAGEAAKAGDAKAGDAKGGAKPAAGGDKKEAKK